MENPAYFTVLHDEGAQPRVNGLLSSKAAAVAAAHARIKAGEPGRFQVAIATLIDQDPTSGTPLGHVVPPEALGYAIGSLTAPDPARRRLDCILFTKEWLVRDLAGSARSRNRNVRGDTVHDIVAITVLNLEI
jgi:hypothetical protein